MKNGNRQPAHALALALVLCMALAAAGCGEAAQETAEFSYAEVPAYADAAYAEINGNVPYFSESDLTLETFESYSELDSLGRCGTAYANICRELMPTEERGSIGQVKPTGWHTVRYDDLIADKYLYNRCHLIGYQLAGENANEKNLITGTRYLNIKGMLDLENEVADYVKQTDNHVLYRVTPWFEGDELVARGVLMEGYSVEDQGEGVCFCVFAYNVQPGIEIDYATGDSRASDGTPGSTGDADGYYIGNVNTKAFHRPSCDNLPLEKNQVVLNSRSKAIEDGYHPCDNCKP